MKPFILWKKIEGKYIYGIMSNFTKKEIGWIDEYGNERYYPVYDDYEDISDDYEEEEEPKPRQLPNGKENISGADWNRYQQRKHYKNLRENLNNSSNPEYTRPQLPNDIKFSPLQHNTKIQKGVSDLMRQAQQRQQANDRKIIESKVYRQVQRQNPAFLVVSVMGSAGYGMSDNDPKGIEGEKTGLWIETFNAQTNNLNYEWVEGVSTYEKVIKNHTLQKGYDFTGNYYERFAYYNGKGTVFGLSDGSTIFPSDKGYSGELSDIAKEGGIYTYDKFTEAKVKSIIERNKIFGIKVDNFGTVRVAPWIYKDFYSRFLRGEDVWKNLGGSSARGKWTTRTSVWQDPFNNYMTPNAMSWSKSAKFFSESLGILGDVISFVDIAKGGSPLGLLPIPVDMIVNEQALEMEKYLFEVAINNESLEGMQNFISGGLRNTKAPLYGFYQQLRFIYTTDEQVNILNAGQLNVTNPYFSYPNESTTKATLIQIEDNKILILKTYDVKK